MGSRSTSRGPAAKQSSKEEIEQARRFAEHVGVSFDKIVEEAPAKKKKLEKLDRRIHVLSSRPRAGRSTEIH